MFEKITKKKKSKKVGYYNIELEDTIWNVP